jgi:diguanylate cyclase (GGDEF)-like protein
MLRERIAEALAARRSLAVIFLDVDHFKRVNDTLGHAAGDFVLADVVGRLQSVARAEDLVARFGGDEFVVVCHDVPDAETAMVLAGRFQAAFGAAFEVSGAVRTLSASAGCRYVTATDDLDVEEILAGADVAMYEAKNAGRDRVQEYTECTRQRVLRRVSLEEALRVALDNCALEVHFQPIVHIGTGRMGGVEALLRWPHCPLGPVSPSEVISVAEEHGLIHSLGLLVLEQTCAQLQAWRALGLQLSATVNVSPLQLQDHRFPARVADALGRWEVEPARLCLEITESAFVADEPALLELRDLGVYIAVDDFGTGWSSLAHLKRLPVEVLKIDRSFVAGLGTESEDAAIVTAIMNLAMTLGLHVIAEGVETELQARELERLGCDTAQGWLYAAAMPADEVVARWRRESTTSFRRPRPGRRAYATLVDEMLHQIGITPASGDDV